MILGYGYRYWDDNVSDDPSATPRAYPSAAVRSEGERAVAAATGREVKARWLKREQVRWAPDGIPLHPTLDDLPLEEVVEKMSKSRGNVVSPDDVIAEFGADSMRLYELFMGPLEKGAPWATDGIPGCFRFLQRAWRLFVDEDAAGEPARALAGGPGTPEQERLTARTIAGVTADMEATQPNTAISKLMVWSRDIAKDAAPPRAMGEAFLKLLSPFAPHLAEELWERLGHTTPVALVRLARRRSALAGGRDDHAGGAGEREATRRGAGGEGRGRGDGAGGGAGRRERAAAPRGQAAAEDDRRARAARERGRLAEAARARRVGERLRLMARTLIALTGRSQNVAVRLRFTSAPVLPGPPRRVSSDAGAWRGARA